MNTTQDICCAYRFDERQAREGIELLRKFYVSSWVMELKEDILKDVCQKINPETKGINQ
jgi:hypothetical protein